MFLRNEGLHPDVFTLRKPIIGFLTENANLPEMTGNKKLVELHVVLQNNNSFVPIKRQV